MTVMLQWIHIHRDMIPKAEKNVPERKSIMKVLAFGSLNIDYVYTVSHFVRPGETIASDELQLFCGGKGLNQSIAFGKSGIDTWHAGAVGNNDSEMLTSYYGIGDCRQQKRRRPFHSYSGGNQAGFHTFLLTIYFR